MFFLHGVSTAVSDYSEGEFGSSKANLGLLGPDALDNVGAESKQSGEVARLLHVARGTVTARGTEDGLVLRIDGRADWGEIVSDLKQFLGERRQFLKGGEVALEWLDRLPTKEQTRELEALLKDSYGIDIIRPKRKDLSSKINVVQSGGNKPQRTTVGGAQPSDTRVSQVGFDAVNPSATNTSICSSSKVSADKLTTRSIDGLGASGAVSNGSAFWRQGSMSDESGCYDVGSADRQYIEHMTRLLGDEFLCDEEANAKVVFGTLRSGQRVETPYSLVVVGDVNPGADLIAGGDIVVFGSLRGTAHAAAYDDGAVDRVIVAMQMKPMQLRIGSVISRGSDEIVAGAELARIENRRIVVESFGPKANQAKRSRVR